MQIPKDPAEQWLVLLAADSVATEFSALIRRLIHDTCKISRSRWLVLITLKTYPAAKTIKELQSMTGLSAGAIRKAVDNATGLFHCSKAAVDGHLLISLSDAGEHFVARMAKAIPAPPDLVAKAESLVDTITPDDLVAASFLIQEERERHKQIYMFKEIRNGDESTRQGEILSQEDAGSGR